MIPFGLVWTVLTLGLLAVLVLGGVRFVRSFLRMLSALSDLAVTSAQLDNVVPTREREPSSTSALSPFAPVLARYSERARRRAELTTARQQRRLARAEAITHVDVASRVWFGSPVTDRSPTTSTTAIN